MRIVWGPLGEPGAGPARDVCMPLKYLSATS